LTPSRSRGAVMAACGEGDLQQVPRPARSRGAGRGQGAAVVIMMLPAADAGIR
jgi:hypothetical protein